jgi:hypothetical protein
MAVSGYVRSRNISGKSDTAELFNRSVIVPVGNSDAGQFFKRPVGTSQCCLALRGVGFRVLLDFIAKWKTESRK